MLARMLCAIASAICLFALGGCCCCNPCGGPGAECGCFCLPKPIVWNGGCSECAPPGQSCADCCGDCGLLPWLRRSMTCGKGCGEIYLGEWISDPPDCCDPCDQCYGCYTGHQGACCLGPFQRLLAACHGYSYCPRPACGPVCGGLCNRGSCGPMCNSCGGAGCASCGGGPAAHGVVLGGAPAFGGYSEGPLPPPANLRTQRPTSDLLPTPAAEPTHSILEEDWNQPKTQPAPGRPIHKAQQPRGPQTASRAQMSRQVPRTAQNTSGLSGRLPPNYLR